MPRASIVVPTHDHHETLPMAVRSALRQSVDDLEVIVLGDGVDDRVRAATGELCADDARVRFLDLPKGPHHGEAYRDLAVREARSPAVFYLCDDDLLLPRHVENLLSLLDDHDLVQCRNGFVGTDGRLVLFPTDLALAEAVEWHLRSPRRNAISLTGTAHRRDSYLELDEGWTTTPEGEWPDHFMWKKLLSRPGARAATHPEMTAVQLPTSAGREQVEQAARAAELRRWEERLSRPDAHEWLQAQVATVTPAQLDRTHRLYVNASIDLRREREQREAERRSLTERAEAAEKQVRRLEESRRDLRRRLSASRWRVRALESSTSWRWTAPLRRLSRRLHRTQG